MKRGAVSAPGCTEMFIQNKKSTGVLANFFEIALGALFVLKPHGGAALKFRLKTAPRSVF